MLTTHPLNHITSLIIKCAIEVHRNLGPGLLEAVYTTCLAFELRTAGLRVATDVIVPVRYKGLAFECGYRLDILIEDAVIVEVKSVRELAAVHPQQLLTYLKVTGREVGLLINFNAPVLKAGVRRVLNTRPADSAAR